MTVDQGAIGAAQAEHVSIDRGALGAAMADRVEVSRGYARSILARQVQLDRAAARIVIAADVRANQSAAMFLIARKVDGNIRVLLDWRGALAFGAVAGVLFRAGLEGPRHPRRPCRERPELAPLLRDGGVEAAGPPPRPGAALPRRPGAPGASP